MRTKRLFRSFLLLALAVLVPVLLGNQLGIVNAATSYVGYGSSALGTSTCGTNCVNTELNRGRGMALKAPLTGQLQSVSVYLGANAPNQLVLLTFSGSPSSSSFSCSSGATCYENVGQSWTVAQVQALSGLTTQAFNTIGLPTPLSVTSGNWYGVVFMHTAGSTLNIMICGRDTSPLCGAGSGQPGTFENLNFDFGTTSPSGAYNSQSRQFDLIVGGTFADIATGSSLLSQCYGNCGSPAVTVVNTNSTYSLNFNQSITIFYQAQSNLQGVINNITAQVAKTYTNNVFFTLAIYRVDASCTTTGSPFTAQCPGQYVHRQSFIINPTLKGKLTASTNIPIGIGQWFGIAFSATFSPPYPNAVALNDTNTNVQLYQAPGSTENLISNFVLLSSAFKPALYSWVTGAQVIVGPIPPSTPSGQICPGLDCILPNIVNSFCTTLTATCQTGSAMFWIIILTFISIATLAYVMVQLMPGVNLAKVGLADMGILIFVGWLVLFTSLSLIQGFVIILVFLIVSWLFIGRLKGTGPI